MTTEEKAFYQAVVCATIQGMCANPEQDSGSDAIAKFAASVAANSLVYRAVADNVSAKNTGSMSL